MECVYMCVCVVRTLMISTLLTNVQAHNTVLLITGTMSYNRLPCINESWYLLNKNSSFPPSHIYVGMLFSFKKEGNPVTCDNMGEPRRHYTMWNELVPEHALHASAYMRSDCFNFASYCQTIFQSVYTNYHLPSCDESFNVGMPGKLANSFLLFKCKGM